MQVSPSISKIDLPERLFRWPHFERPNDKTSEGADPQKGLSLA